MLCGLEREVECPGEATKGNLNLSRRAVPIIVEKEDGIIVHCIKK